MYEADNPQLPTGPMHMLVDAAVGLFDVSGFSKIADRLEKEEASAGSTVSTRRFSQRIPPEAIYLARKSTISADVPSLTAVIWPQKVMSFE